MGDDDKPVGKGRVRDSNAGDRLPNNYIIAYPTVIASNCCHIPGSRSRLQ